MGWVSGEALQRRSSQGSVVRSSAATAELDVTQTRRLMGPSVRRWGRGAGDDVRIQLKVKQRGPGDEEDPGGLA